MIGLRENSQLYNMHELQYAAIAPLRLMAHAGRQMISNPFSPLAYTGLGRSLSAGLEVVERITNRYAKPEFGITETVVDGKKVMVTELVEGTPRPFCRLLHFKKAGSVKQPRLLIVAPMSGHHATLLRGTVEAMLPFTDVYITDWMDARYVPLYEGKFGLEEYIAYTIDYIKHLGPDVHVMAVCQPAVPTLIAAAVMNAEKNPCTPRSIVLIGGPIDTRANPTRVNTMAQEHSLNWFGENMITRVPVNYPGFMRRVYPGFMQLTSFMSLNMGRHLQAHVDLFKHLVQGDGESVEAHKKFYDEYLSVADLPAEFYLDCIEQVFQRQLLPKGEFVYKGKKVDCAAITQTGLLTLEGELDDISGVGQTEAAQKLCKNLPANKRRHHLQKGVGHYGIFNGRKFREHVVPIIVDFIGKQA